jgi:hypothetical protein
MPGRFCSNHSIHPFFEVLEGLHPEVTIYRRGDWMRLGGDINRLIDPCITDMGTGSAFYGQYVRMEND